MNTLRQLTKRFNRNSIIISFSQPFNAVNIVNEVIALQSAATRDEYLEWLAVWKKTNEQIVKAIKILKANRNNDPLFESELATFRFLARRLYTSRSYMKDISFNNKLGAEIDRIEQLFNTGVEVAA